ncbi:MAG: C10 family peptidase [Kiritimatiellae bacterium]|nr:C10 family peptidase [Kiritimatiellia bacterium]
MKLIVKFVFSFAAFFAAFALWAAEVSPEQAQAAVGKWISLGPKRMDSEFQSKDAETPKTVRSKTGRAVYHAVNLKGGGFVVTSGDTRLPPIIAFSTEGRFSGDESGPFHALLQKDLAGAVSALERSDRKVAAASSGQGGGANPYAAAMAEWSELLPSKSAAAAEGDRRVCAVGSRKTSVSDVRVGKLLKTEWGQVGDIAWNSQKYMWDDYYVFNYYTPNNYPCGCVATAGAQIMKYWEMPKNSIAQFSNACVVDKKKTTQKSIAGAFDWSNMFLIWDQNAPAPSAAQIKAVGMLTYNIAVAVGMEWGPGFGSASPSVLVDVMKTRFGYKSGTFIYHDIDALSEAEAYRPDDFEQRVADFNNALYASLDAKMPVILSVDGHYGGHAIVADGYGYTSGKRYTHLNFGWYGGDDAWYYLVNEPLLVRDDQETYFEFEGIGFNIHPTEAGDVLSGRVLDAAGTAVAGATVTLYDSAKNAKASTTTDSKGIYSFRITATGRYTVRASNDKTEEEPSESVNMSVLSTGGSYGYYNYEAGNNCETGNKWGVDLKFTEWAAPVKRTLTLKPNSTSRGTVSGGGKYLAGKTVTITAKAESGNAFGGWFTDKACKNPLNPDDYDNLDPKVKIVMPAENTTIYAKFITKAADKKALKFSSKTKKLANTPAGTVAGEEFYLGLGISSASLVTVSAKGLPKGLDIDKATGEITGTPTKFGTFTATVTVKSAAGNKITQKVKIKVLMPEWARGTYYGVAYPNGTGKPPASLKFTVGSTGSVSGKMTSGGKAYSFKVTCSSYASSGVKFSPKVKMGSKSFSPGTLTIKTRGLADEVFVKECANSKRTFIGQKKPNLVKEGGKLAALIGRTDSFTKADEGSGLTKAKDKLDVRLANGDSVKVSGTVGGKTLSLSAPLIVLDSTLVVIDEGKESETYVTRYSLCACVIDAKLKYYKELLIDVDIGDYGAVVDFAASLQ